MPRILMSALLGLSLHPAAFADEPKPQWQRMLTGGDAKKAAELDKQVAQLEAVDNYKEAIRLEEELLALRTRLQGADHWETISQKFRLALVKNIAALPEEKRTGFLKSTQSTAAFAELLRQAQYAKALAVCQEHLKWCRLVAGELHPETAYNYTNVAIILQYQGQPALAAPQLQKALDISRAALGENHPSTAAAYNNVANNLGALGKHAAAAPLYEKALAVFRSALGEEHAHTAASYNTFGLNRYHLGKYAEAEPLLQKALKIRRKILSEDHADTATSYNNVGINLSALAKYADAELVLIKALDIQRNVLRENHPSIAHTCNNLAGNYKAQGKFAEAGPLFQKALEIYLKVFGENNADTAMAYNNVASNLEAEGKHAEAGSLYRKALDIHRRTLGENHPYTALSYNNVASSLSHQRLLAEAQPLYEKALRINRKVLGETHPHTAICYNNLGLNLSDQDKYDQAEPLLQKALDIRRQRVGEEHPDTATNYHNLAVNCNARRKFAEAEGLYRTALKIRRKALGEDHPLTASSYAGIAGTLQNRGRYGEAAPLHEKALQITRTALGEDHPDTVRTYLNYALNLLAEGKDAAAVKTSEAAVASYEAARLSVAASGLDRAAFGDTFSPYAMLAAARLRAGRTAAAWQAVEADLARGLLDDFATPGTLELNPSERQQRDALRNQRAPLETRILALASKAERAPAESAELQRLLKQRQVLDKSLGDLAGAASRRKVASLAQLQAAIPADAALLAWIDVFDKFGGVHEHWGCVVRSTGDPHWERMPGSSPDGKWTREDIDLPWLFRQALAGAAPAARIQALAGRLHAQRLAPLRKHLDGVTRLFVATVREMSGVPIDALTDAYTVSYAPSGTYIARLKDRNRPNTTGVLAVGDPVFPPLKDSPTITALPPGGLLITQVLPNGNAAKARLQAGDVLVSYAGEPLASFEQLDKLIKTQAGVKSVIVKVWREKQDTIGERELGPGRLGVGLAKEPAREAITARRQTEQMLAKLTRGESFAELPGTQVEITRLAGLFEAKNVTTLTRADASEQRLDAMRKADRLKQFKYLHFATHGKANNFRSFDSALILTPPAKIPEPRAGEPWLDGRLTAAEVLEYWKLDAELVTLSACESALGRQGGGDGLLGFAQAFLLAGSRSVCLTLWQVDDTATALLMDRFYRNLLGKRADGAKPMGKAAALHEAKQWLRNLSAGEALEHLGTLTNGVVRGERPARQEMKAVPVPKDAAKDYKPYAHPRYWAAFILIGDPE